MRIIIIASLIWLLSLTLVYIKLTNEDNLLYSTILNCNPRVWHNISSDRHLPLANSIHYRGIARVTCYRDTGTMANGNYTRPGSVASSDRTIPFGTRINIQGIGNFTVEDRTAAWVDAKFRFPTFDIWSEDCDKNFGAKELPYAIYEPY